jgi:hypothetical protein
MRIGRRFKTLLVGFALATLVLSVSLLAYCAVHGNPTNDEYEAVRSLDGVTPRPYVAISDDWINQAAGMIVGYNDPGAFWFNPQNSTGRALYDEATRFAKPEALLVASRLNNASVALLVLNGGRLEEDLASVVGRLLANFTLVATFRGSIFVFSPFRQRDVGLVDDSKPALDYGAEVVPDKIGIPLYKYSQIGPQYNPNVVALYALRFYEALNSASLNASLKRSLENRIFSIANWLVTNRLVAQHPELGRYSLWTYEFSFTIENLTYSPPWHSAIAQAQGIRALLRAQSLQGNSSYLEAIEDSLVGLLVPLIDGGVLVQSGQYYWFEEYASRSQRPLFVLNGFTFALLSAYEVIIRSKSLGISSRCLRSAQLIWKEGMYALLHFLPLFDAGHGLSYYSLQLRNIDIYYHKLVVKHLSSLWSISDSPTVRRFLDRWLIAVL